MHKGFAVSSLLAVILGAALFSAVALAGQGLELMTVNGGEVVYDTNNQVYWLADANLAATQLFGISGIDPNGAMDYPTAKKWVAALNAQRYLGHTDWQLPATPLKDATCGAEGPGGASFGALCTTNALGNLYYVGLGNVYPTAVALITGAKVGLLQNLQSSYYWTNTSGGVTGRGKQVFSFNSGQADVTETHDAYYYVLPMVPKKAGPIGGSGAAPSCASGAPLELYTQGPAANQTVYDCSTVNKGVSWPVNANLAASPLGAFGVTGTVEVPYNRPYPKRHPITLTPPKISNGAMLWDTAQSEWLPAMNAYKGKGYLESQSWQLPESPNDLATLFGYLKLASGDRRFLAPGNVGPFRNVQPFFYWEVCVPDPNGPGQTSPDCEAGNAPPGKAGRQLNYDFSFGYGLQSTDLFR
jgi:hypothetical protein